MKRVALILSIVLLACGPSDPSSTSETLDIDGLAEVGSEPDSADFDIQDLADAPDVVVVAGPLA